MLDIGWSELLVIAVVLIVVVGPKELPGVLRTFGQWMGKARTLSREFQYNMNQLAREAETETAKTSSVSKGPASSGAAVSDPQKGKQKPDTESRDESAVQKGSEENTKKVTADESAASKADDESEAADVGSAPWAAPGPPPNPGYLKDKSLVNTAETDEPEDGSVSPDQSDDAGSDRTAEISGDKSPRAS